MNRIWMKKLITTDPVWICGLDLIGSDIQNFRWEAWMYGIWHALPLVYHATCSCIMHHRRDAFPCSRDVFPRSCLVHVLMHFHVSLCIITHHRISSPIIQERLTMSDHLIGTSYSLSHGCNKPCSVITCYYILSAHFLPIPSMSDTILSSI